MKAQNIPVRAIEPRPRKSFVAPLLAIVAIATVTTGITVAATPKADTRPTVAYTVNAPRARTVTIVAREDSAEREQRYRDRDAERDSRTRDREAQRAADRMQREGERSQERAMQRQLRRDEYRASHK